MPTDDTRPITDMLLLEMSYLLMPLQRLDSPRRITALLHDLGWALPEQQVIDVTFPELADSISDLVDAIGRMAEAETDEDKLIEAAFLALEIANVVAVIFDLVGEIKAAVARVSDFLEKSEIEKHFAERLFDFLTVTYLQVTQPQVYGILTLLGIVEVIPTNEDKVKFQPKFDLRKVWWDRIPKLFSDPGSLAEDVYKWGVDFNAELFLSRLELLLRCFLQPGGLYGPQLRLPLYRAGRWPDTYGELGLGISPEGEKPEDKGLSIIPYLYGHGEVKIDLEEWQVTLGGSIGLKDTFDLLIRPPREVELNKGSVEQAWDSMDARFETGITRTEPGDRLLLLFGSQDSSRLGLKQVGVHIWVAKSGKKREFGAELEIEQLTLVISPAQADGFIQKLLSGISIETACDIALGWSSPDGIYFRGSAALEVTIPIHRPLGPLNLASIYLCFSVGGDADLVIVLAVTADAKIGPVAASVERVGIAVPINFPKGGGNYGPLQLDGLRFKPPLGAGLVLDAGVVVGGGYLEIDAENERYAGILQLKIGEIGLVAIGLITTRLPDGSRGFSMLVIIAVEFTPPITLPYNFTLSGVGGLIGIHRAMIIAAIQQGIKNRTIDSILFPSDPIKNASKIISDLRAVFPPCEGQFVLGPMVIIGWSTPNLIRAEIGILIQLPDPINIAVVGQLVSELPTKDMAVVELHVDVLGVIDPAKGTFAMDAVIYDSRILAFSLTGDMAMRLRWTQDPTLAISFGGLNPRFKMTNFPKLRRVTLSLGIGDNPRISLECYLALTSNTTQFGARLEVYASKAGFNIKGHLSFDTLIIFVPFSLTADIGGSVEVSKGKRSLLTANLDMTISGPTPWHARGKAKFKLAVVKLSVKFDKKWGRCEKAELPPADAWPLLEAALKEAGNWAGVPPAQAEMAVSLKPAPGGDGELVLHPHGTLEIRQRVLPLNMKLEKFGNSSLSGESKFTISEVTIGGQSLSLAPIQDRFARAQFIKMSDKEALSLPSYEMLDAGVRAGSEKIACGPAQPCALACETVVIDEDKLAQQVGANEIDWGRGRALHAQSASALAPVRRSGLGKYKSVNVTPKVTLQEEAYAIVSNKNLARCEQIGGNNGPLTYSQASQVLRDYLDGHPEEAAELQIVPECEVAL